MSLIEFDNIDFSYKTGRKIFENFSLKLEPQKPGFVTAIMGASGSGKSTLLKLILGIEKIQTGKLTLNPVDPIISYVPQEPVLFEHMSPEKNARYFEFAGLYKNRFNKSIYNELVSDLGLKQLLETSKSVNEISGGQKQRLSLLRALSINPDFILLDEPCSGLDTDVKLSFLKKLREITEQYKLYVLYITHHKLESQLIADEIVYLNQDTPESTVNTCVKDSIMNFIEKPPTLDAAMVFKFPEVNILPVSKNINGEYTLTNNKNATHFWLVDQSNFKFSDNDGWNFQISSKSPIYSNLINKEFDIEISILTDRLNGLGVGSSVKVEVNNTFLKYSNTGLLIK